jgi:hypothetical protein
LASADKCAKLPDQRMKIPCSGTNNSLFFVITRTGPCQKPVRIPLLLSITQTFSRFVQVPFQISGNSCVWTRYTGSLECRCGTVVARRRDFGRKSARPREPAPAKRRGFGRSVRQLRAIRSDFWNCSGDLGLPGGAGKIRTLGPILQIWSGLLNSNWRGLNPNRSEIVRVEREGYAVPINRESRPIFTHA